MITQLLKSDFEKILTIRAFEEGLLELFRLGLIGGTVHTCVGQEVNSVILSKFKQKGDFTLSNHRGHGHFLSFNDFQYEGMLKEILGRSDGCSNGIGGSQHLSAPQFLSNGIQGGMTPIGAGLAYALKNKNSNVKENPTNCVFVFIGDGTLGQGVLYESLNICGLQGLPIVFVLEDNEIAQSTPTKYTFGGDLESRIAGFGIDYVFVENVCDKIEEIGDSVLNARKGRPQFLHLKSSRLLSHSKGDDNRDPNYINEIIQRSKIEIAINSSEYYVNFLNEKRSFFIAEGKRLKEDINFFSFSKIQYKSIDKIDNVSSIQYSNERYNARINKALNIFLEGHPNSLIIGEDIRDRTIFPCDSIEYGGAFRVTAGLSTKFPERVLNFPISEQLIIGFSTGYSLINGWIICEIMFADFLTLAVDQIIQHLSKFKLMLGGIHNPKVIIRTPIGGYRGYGPTHSQCVENLFIGIPNLNVIAANKYISPEYYMDYIMERGAPTIFIENKILYTEISKNSDFIEHELLLKGVNSPLVYSKTRYVKSNCIVLTYGQLLSVVEEASEDLLLNDELGLDSVCFSDLNDLSFSELLVNILNRYSHFLVLTESKEFASWASQVGFELFKKLGNVNVEIYGNNWIVPASPNFEKLVLPSKIEIIKWVKNRL